MQFAVERVRAGVKQRVARKALDKVLDKGHDAGRACARATPELTRLWASAAFCDLRADLPPQGVEKLYQQLAAVLSGDTPPAVWHATIAALRKVRHATESSADAAPRKWRQVFPDLNGW